MGRAWIGLAGALVLPLTAGAADRRDGQDVRYAPPQAWVQPPPPPSDAPSPAEAPLRIVYVDNQVRIGAAGEEAYTAYRLKILKPEALPAGNIAVAWSPGAGEAVVHRLRLHRDGATIDVLAQHKFAILRREGGLEQSMLDGQLTATLQVPGLQVGDEIEFAATVAKREPAFGGHSAGVLQLPPMGAPGAFRVGMAWPQATPLVVRATRDLPQRTPEVTGDERRISYELRDPAGSIPTEGAPARFNLRRVVEYSDFASWRALSVQIWPLFERASRLAPGSPVRAEAARIAAATSDQAARAEAALQLVQDRIRYVYVGLDGGNYTPAPADETWTRRFGDCKAKTVLLMALLRELGISAEPVLVASDGGDGTDERLPSPHVFDHVLVRAHPDGATHWLDGTRLGDRRLDTAAAAGVPLGAAAGGRRRRPGAGRRRARRAAAGDRRGRHRCSARASANPPR